MGMGAMLASTLVATDKNQPIEKRKKFGRMAQSYGIKLPAELSPFTATAKAVTTPAAKASAPKTAQAPQTSTATARRPAARKPRKTQTLFTSPFGKTSEPDLYKKTLLGK